MRWLKATNRITGSCIRSRKKVIENNREFEKNHLASARSAWVNEKGIVTIVLNIGTELRYPAKTQLVLVENNDDLGREPGEEG